MKADYYVYVYIDPTKDEPFYIGAGQGKRAWKHLTRCKSKSYDTHFYKRLGELLELGVQPIIHLIVEGVTREEAFGIWEPFFIKGIGRHDLGMGPLCNQVDGGAGGHIRSLEARERMSIAVKKYCAYPYAKAQKSTAAKKPWADPEHVSHIRNKPPKKGIGV